MISDVGSLSIVPKYESPAPSARIVLGIVVAISHLLFFFRMVRYSGQLRDGSLEAALVVDNRVYLGPSLGVVWRASAAEATALPVGTRSTGCMWNDTSCVEMRAECVGVGYAAKEDL